MGVWRTGLYSGDFALDLRGSIKAVLRLPFEADKLLQLLCDLEPTSANDPNDEDHSTFWLVVADQFTKAGVQSERARETALHVIDAGTDLAMLTRLAMDAPDLKKRAKVLASLREFLSAPPRVAHPRQVLKKPQTLIFSVGDLLIYPTSLGRCRESHSERIQIVPAWKQDAWGAAVIVRTGLACGFLAWYLPLLLDSPVAEKPDLAGIRSARGWSLRRPGTCSAAIVRSLGLEEIGKLPLDGEKLRRAFPGMRDGTRATLENLSISRDLSAARHPPAAYVVRTAFPNTPEGEAKFQNTVKELEERLAKASVYQERLQASPAVKNQSIAVLDDILL